MISTDFSNIAEMWQRFMDCQLSEKEEAELMAYLENNPEIMAMLEDDSAENAKLDDKEMLSAENITERLLIEKIEGVISEKDEKYIDAEIATDTKVNQSYKAYKLTIQKPDLDIHYPNKDGLKKRGIVIWLKPVSIAATIAIMATSGILLYQSLKTSENTIPGHATTVVPTDTQSDLYAQTENKPQEIITSDTADVISVKPELIKPRANHTTKVATAETNENLAQNTDTTSYPATSSTLEIEEIVPTDNIAETDNNTIEQVPEQTDTTIINTNTSIEQIPEELFAYQPQNNGVTIVKDTEFRKRLRRRASEIRNSFEEDKTVGIFRKIGDEIALAFINNKK